MQAKCLNCITNYLMKRWFHTLLNEKFIKSCLIKTTWRAQNLQFRLLALMHYKEGHVVCYVAMSRAYTFLLLVAKLTKKILN